MRTFLLIWSGQVVSLLGSALTGFALGVWVYQQTGSATQFALISLFTALPGILISPWAGALVDRVDRRVLLLLSDSGSGLCTLAIAALITANDLTLWKLYLALAVSSLFSSVQWLAYSAATSVLVPQRQLGRANGLMQLGEALGQIAAPVLAAALIASIGIRGILLVDLATYCWSIATLLTVRIPAPGRTAESNPVGAGFLREAGYGWRYIRRHSGLLALLVFFAASNYAVGLVSVLFTPMILGFTDQSALGLILSVGGSGMLAGSLLMSVWGGPRRQIYGVLIPGLLQGIVISLAGLPPSVPLITSLAFVYFFALPLINGSSQAIWQAKVHPDIQGRVFAIRRMIAWSSLPLAYLSAGPLADAVFEPRLRSGGAWAASVGALIGTGPGRGIALLFVVLGLALIALALAGIGYAPLRDLELQLPDASRADDASPAPLPG